MIRPSFAALPLAAALILLTPNEAYGHYLNSPTNRNEAGNVVGSARVGGWPPALLAPNRSPDQGGPVPVLPVLLMRRTTPRTAAPRSLSQLSSVSRDWTRPNLNLPPVPPTPRTSVINERDDAQPTQDVGRMASRGGVVVSGEGSATPLSPQRFAQELVGPTQFACLDNLWRRESNWRPTANNPRSTAYGIAQELGETSSDARTQILDGLAYISARYHSACAAWAFWRGHGWY